MKRKTSKEILAESFRELAEKQSIDKITIKDIVDNCGYSPATFYRQFKDKYDLIAWDYTNEVGQIMRKAGEESRWEQSLKDGALYYHEHKEYLSNLLEHTKGYESFRRNMAQINYSHLRDFILKRTGSIDYVTDMCIRLYCYGTVELTCEWILGKVGLDVDELVEVYERCVPELLRSHLL